MQISEANMRRQGEEITSFDIETSQPEPEPSLRRIQDRRQGEEITSFDIETSQPEPEPEPSLRRIQDRRRIYRIFSGSFLLGSELLYLSLCTIHYTLQWSILTIVIIPHYAKCNLFKLYLHAARVDAVVFALLASFNARVTTHSATT